MIQYNLNEQNINEFGRFDNLLEQVDYEKAKKYIEKINNKPMTTLQARMLINKKLLQFIINGGKDIEE